MKNKEKKLLLQVLCAMLPYGVECLTFDGQDGQVEIIGKLCSFTELADGSILFGLTDKIYDAPDKYYQPRAKFKYETIKPFLRPMSSMTEEERLELSRLTDDKFKFYLYTTKPEIICYEKYNYLEGLKVLDWLNAHYFDYRGLIEKGLALESPEGMYKEGGEQ